MLSLTANIERNAIKLSVAGRQSKRRNYESRESIRGNSRDS